MHHSVADCTSEVIKCVNCLTAIKNDKADLNSDHAAWDTECPIYKMTVEKFKKDLLFKQ